VKYLYKRVTEITYQIIFPLIYSRRFLSKKNVLTPIGMRTPLSCTVRRHPDSAETPLSRRSS